MVLLLQPLSFVDHGSVDDKLTSPSSLWNAGRHFSQWLLWRDCVTAPTPIDVSRSLRQDVFTPPSHSTTQSIVPCINSQLPPEILREIFRHYVFDENPGWLNGFSRIAAHRNARTNVLPLCHVCSHWRAIAFSTSSLWSSLCVVWPKRGHVHLVRLWLERSGSRPLSLDLGEAREDLGREGIVAMRDIFSLCIAHAWRWQDVSLHLDHTVQDIVCDLREDSMRSLESLDVDLSGWDESHQEKFSKLFHSSPSLRRAAWGLSFEDAFPVNAPWTQLSEVKLVHVEGLEQLFTALSQCIRLEILDIGRVVSFSPPRLPPVSLFNLFDLRLGRIDDLPLLLDSLTLPQLKNIELCHSFRGPPPQGWSSLCNLLARSSCLLKRFKCSTCNFDENEVTSALISPSMTSLIDLLLYMPISDKLLNALVYKKAAPLMPHLASLVLDDCQTTDGCLSNFIDSRATTLRSVRAQLCGRSTYVHDLHMAGRYQQDNIMIDLFLFEGGPC